MPQILESDCQDINYALSNPEQYWDDRTMFALQRELGPDYTREMAIQSFEGVLADPGLQIVEPDRAELVTTPAIVTTPARSEALRLANRLARADLNNLNPDQRLDYKHDTELVSAFIMLVDRFPFITMRDFLDSRSEAGRAQINSQKAGYVRQFMEGRLTEDALSLLGSDMREYLLTQCLPKRPAQTRQHSMDLADEINQFVTELQTGGGNAAAVQTDVPVQAEADQAAIPAPVPAELTPYQTPVPPRADKRPGYQPPVPTGILDEHNLKAAQIDALAAGLTQLAPEAPQASVPVTMDTLKAAAQSLRAGEMTADNFDTLVKRYGEIHLLSKREVLAQLSQ